MTGEEERKLFEGDDRGGKKKKKRRGLHLGLVPVRVKKKKNQLSSRKMEIGEVIRKKRRQNEQERGGTVGQPGATATGKG